MFHCMAYESANLLVGGNGADRGTEEWSRVYRALDHGAAKSACKHRLVQNMTQTMQDFALAFVALQEARHRADYDPFDRPKRSEVLAEIDRIEAVIAAFVRAPRRARRLFCVHVLFKQRV